jgi:hypothetical protein
VLNENLHDLERAVGQLRKCVKTLAVENQPGQAATSIEHLLKLQADIEAIGRAIEDQRWACEGAKEFQGE